MVGPGPAREEESAQLTGPRGEFVSSLGRRIDGLRAALKLVEQSPEDGSLRNALLRRVHALSSAARVLGFASAAEALTEAEKRLRQSDYNEFSRSLDLLPSLLLGVPVSLRPAAAESRGELSATWPLSVLVFGGQALALAMQSIPDTHVECVRTEDWLHAREQVKVFGPDLAIIDADQPGARELVEALGQDGLGDTLPLIVVGDFDTATSAESYMALGAVRVLPKPVAPESLQRTAIELRALTVEPEPGLEPLGELSVEALAERISSEVRRGLLESVAPNSRNTRVGFGDGADVIAAVWGAVARVRELVTLRSSGAVRFDARGPGGAVPITAWGHEERRAGERGTGGGELRTAAGVALQGRRIVVADDDPAVVWFMSGLLRALGVDVLEAHDGARALELTYEHWPDLVVSDVLMPKLDGFSLCHEIKRDVAVRDVPVVLLSWKEDLLQRVRELGSNADGYLRKEAAASTVAERLREVLRPRARVEQRIAAGGEARGRLDGLTPRLILELAAAEARDVRVGIRDAVYLYELQIRRGRLCSATRSSATGSFERGEAVLAALLGVSAGRFVVEPDQSSCRVELDGTPAQLLKAPVERARAALQAISAGALVGVTRVHVASAMIEGYLPCTPEPARRLLNQVIDGASPRDLLTSGAVAPLLLETVLSDLARRGAITAVDRESREPTTLRGPAPPDSEPPAAQSAAEESTSGEPSLVGVADTVRHDADFSVALDASSLPPSTSTATRPGTPSDTGEVAALPFSPEVTPFARGVAEELSGEPVDAAIAPQMATLHGVGMPEVAAANASLEPVAPHKTPEELDALAAALADGSPPPSPVRAVHATQVMAAVSLPLSPDQAQKPPASELESTLLSAPPAARPSVSPSRVSSLKAPLRSTVPQPSNSGASRVSQFVVIAMLSFIAAYVVISYLRPAAVPSQSHSPTPAAS